MVLKKTTIKPLTKKEINGYITGNEYIDLIESIFFELFVQHGIIKTINNKKETMYSGDDLRMTINSIISLHNKKIQ